MEPTGGLVPFNGRQASSSTKSGPMARIGGGTWLFVFVFVFFSGNQKATPFSGSKYPYSDTSWPNPKYTKPRGCLSRGRAMRRASPCRRITSLRRSTRSPRPAGEDENGLEPLSASQWVFHHTTKSGASSRGAESKRV